MCSGICLLSFYQRNGLKKNITAMEAKNDLRHIALQSASFHRVIRLRLSDKVMQFVI